jgi:hypothetical protein
MLAEPILSGWVRPGYTDGLLQPLTSVPLAGLVLEQVRQRHPGGDEKICLFSGLLVGKT